MEPEFQTEFVTAGSLLYSVEHRPWLPPDSHWLVSQSWDNILLAHFALAPATLRPFVPDGFTLDLYDGVAWLTVSPFCATHVRPSGIPPLPGFSFFSQLNLRTYVTLEGKSGIFYLSVDVASLSAVWFARIFFRMQYWHAAIRFSRNNSGVDDSVARTMSFRASRLRGPAACKGPAEFEVMYRPEGDPEPVHRATLEEFLTERYCIYSWNRGKYYRTEVHHQPWSLQPASVELQANTLAEPFGFALPARPDLCYFSPSVKMLVWAPESIRLR